MQKRKRFGEILIDAKVVDEPTLERALERQKGTDRRLGQVFEQMGVVTEKDIAAALARQFGYKTVSNIAKANFSPELLNLTDADTAMKRMLFPLKKDGRTLYLALVNPLDIEVIDNISFKSGLRVVPCVTTPSEIQAAVNRHYLKIVQTSNEPDEWWTVLVVDDQDLVRSAAVAALKREGYTLLEAANYQPFPARSLSDAASLLANQAIDLILLDITLVKDDNGSLVTRLRQDDKAKSLPFLILTSRSNEPGLHAVLKAGGSDGYIEKPLRVEDLLSRLKKLLP